MADGLAQCECGDVPAELGREVEWSPIFDDDNVSISVAPADALLAMKLNAARPRRDTDDIAKLLVLNRIDDKDAAQELFESFYPGEILSPRAQAMVRRIFEIGMPDQPEVPPAFSLE